MRGREDPNVRPVRHSTGALAGGAAQGLTVLLLQPGVHLLEGQTPPRPPALRVSSMPWAHVLNGAQGWSRALACL